MAAKEKCTVTSTEYKNKNKSFRAGRSIRVEAMLQSTVVDSPVEQGITPAITCERLSHAKVDAGVLQDEPP